MTGYEYKAEILGSLCQHRVLSSPQIRAIHFPDRGERWSQRVMAGLAEEGLVTFTRAPGGIRNQPRRLWFVTEEGAEAARWAGIVDGNVHLLSSEQVVGPLQAHTHAVNDVGIGFLATARQRGDEFGPLSWRHEVGHPVSRRRWVVADAVLTYLRMTEEEMVLEQRFVEVDRGTLSIDRLEAELSRYASLYLATAKGGEPVWRSSYSWFPAVICVMADAPRRLLERRRQTVAALLERNLELSHAPEVSIRICLAEDLAVEGPFAPIFLDPREPDSPVDWLVEAS